MLKSPISRTGQIQYYELIKLVVLMAFLYALISKGLNASPTLAASTPFISIITITLFTIDLVLINSLVFKEILSLLAHVMITLVNNFICFKSLQLAKIDNFMESVITYNQKSYLRLNVIRC